MSFFLGWWIYLNICLVSTVLWAILASVIDYEEIYTWQWPAPRHHISLISNMSIFDHLIFLICLEDWIFSVPDMSPQAFCFLTPVGPSEAFWPHIGCKYFKRWSEKFQIVDVLNLLLSSKNIFQVCLFVLWISFVVSNAINWNLKFSNIKFEMAVYLIEWKLIEVSTKIQ